MTARHNQVPPWFGMRIRKARERQGWTLRDLAGKCSLQASTVLRAEAGRDLALSSALAISSALNLTLADLLAEPSCGTCDGMPPEGFSCNECGRGGT